MEPASPFMSDEALMPLLAALNPEGAKSDLGGAQAVIAAARDLPLVTSSSFSRLLFYCY